MPPGIRLEARAPNAELPQTGNQYPGLRELDAKEISLHSEFGSPVTGSHERAELLGARASDVLIGLIERGKYGISDQPNTLLVDGDWNPGSTVKRQK